MQCFISTPCPLIPVKCRNKSKSYLQQLKEEKSSSEAELNSWKIEIGNTVRIYQGFCDRNLELKKREDELLDTLGKLEGTGRLGSMSSRQNLRTIM
jgi:hypothetical protein